MTPAPEIHPTAIIHPTAQIASGVTIGPYAIVGPQCIVGPNCKLGPHSVLEERVKLGEGVMIGSSAVMGSAPQDAKYKGEPTWVEVDDFAQLREFSTVHRATGEGQVTRVGTHTLLMAYAHVGHNTQVGQHCTIANAVQLAGHVVVENHVTIGGATVVHQNCVLGQMAMIGGLSACRQDVPPFAMANGYPVAISNINVIGLRRQGLSAAERLGLRLAYKLLFFNTESPWADRMAEVESHLQDAPNAYVADLLDFLANRSKRGVPSNVKLNNKRASFTAGFEMEEPQPV